MQEYLNIKIFLPSLNSVKLQFIKTLIKSNKVARYFILFDKVMKFGDLSSDYVIA
jgi:hypothetical protein